MRSSTSGAASWDASRPQARTEIPHVAPVGMISYNPHLDTLDIRGHDLTNTKKFRDIARSGRAAVVVDDLAATKPWRARGIEVRGSAEAIEKPEPVIRIHPQRIVAWVSTPTGSSATADPPDEDPAEEDEREDPTLEISLTTSNASCTLRATQ